MLDEIMESTERTPIEVALQMDEDGFVSGRNLYDFLQLDKSHYVQWCKSNIVENVFAEEGTDYQVFAMKSENPLGGRPTTEYKLIPSFAKKLAMTSHSERGERARDYFIACEKSLQKVAEIKNEWQKEREQARLSWNEERAKGILMRHILTDTIKMKISDSPHKKFAYPNYTKLIYKTIFGKSLDELKADFGVKEKESLREHMTADQLQEVDGLECLISGLIGIGMGYDEIKSFVGEKYHQRLAG